MPGSAAIFPKAVLGREEAEVLKMIKVSSGKNGPHLLFKGKKKVSRREREERSRDDERKRNKPRRGFHFSFTSNPGLLASSLHE